MSAQWHYTHNGESAGPVSSEELRHLATTGQIGPDDLVWKTGMAEWSPAGKIKGLFPAAPAAAAARPAAAMVAAPVAMQPMAAEPSQIGYFSTTSGLPPRTAKTLKGYAPATGDRGDWPLDDQQLVQLQTTEKHRKKIRNAAGLYRGLFALTLIGTVIVLIASAFAMAGPRGGGPAVYGLGVAVAIMGGLSVLYYFASGATKKCHRWAPLTLFILFMLTVGLQVVSIVMAASSSRGAGGEAIAGIFGMILPGAFAASSWQAFSSIPKFLASPMWCQEALVNSKL